MNIARGTLVDQDALRVALDDGRVAMATLDTVDPEPLPAGHWMYSHPKVRLSAHISWYNPELQGAAIEIFIDNLGRFARGEAAARGRRSRRGLLGRWRRHGELGAVVVGTGFGRRVHVPALRAAGFDVHALVGTRRGAHRAPRRTARDRRTRARRSPTRWRSTASTR